MVNHGFEGSVSERPVTCGADLLRNDSQHALRIAVKESLSILKSISSGQLSRKSDQSQPRAAAPLHERIYALLACHDGADRRWLATLAGASLSSTCRALAFLQRKGVVAAEGTTRDRRFRVQGK